MRIEGLNIQITGLEEAHRSTSLKLDAGDTIHAKVLEISDNQLALHINDNKIIRADTGFLDAAKKDLIKPGMDIELSVYAKNEGKVLVRLSLPASSSNIIQAAPVTEIAITSAAIATTKAAATATATKATAATSVITTIEANTIFEATTTATAANTVATATAGTVANTAAATSAKAVVSPQVSAPIPTADNTASSPQASAIVPSTLPLLTSSMGKNSEAINNLISLIYKEFNNRLGSRSKTANEISDLDGKIQAIFKEYDINPNSSIVNEIISNLEKLKDSNTKSGLTIPEDNYDRNILNYVFSEEWTESFRNSGLNKENINIGVHSFQNTGNINPDTVSIAFENNNLFSKIGLNYDTTLANDLNTGIADAITLLKRAAFLQANSINTESENINILANVLEGKFNIVNNINLILREVYLIFGNSEGINPDSNSLGNLYINSNFNPDGNLYINSNFNPDANLYINSNFNPDANPDVNPDINYYGNSDGNQEYKTVAGSKTTSLIASIEKLKNDLISIGNSVIAKSGQEIVNPSPEGIKETNNAMPSTVYRKLFESLYALKNEIVSSITEIISKSGRSELINANNLLNNDNLLNSANNLLNSANNLLNRIDNLQSGLKIINELQTFYSFFQVPLPTGNSVSDGRIYILRKQKNRRKINPEDSTILLSLDLSNMGHLELFTKVYKKTVTLSVHVEKSDILKHIKDNSLVLYKALENTGYKLAGLFARNDNTRILPEDAATLLKNEFVVGNKLDIVL